MSTYVVAMTGASGSAYAVRLLEVLLAGDHTVHLTISPSACQVFKHEMGGMIDVKAFSISQLMIEPSENSNTTDRQRALNETCPPKPNVGRLIYHHYQDFSAGIASGSFLTDGMVVCPCSMGTLSAIAHGLSQNLIHRAADVHLKERRKLIVVPRETPFSLIALDNMKRLAEAGGIILPAMPGFYQKPQQISDLIDFVVARICDQLHVSNSLMRRWGKPSGEESRSELD